MPKNPSTPRDFLLESTAVLARGGDLGHQLAAFAGNAALATHGNFAVVYLLDPETGTLTPEAASGIEPAELEGLDVAEPGSRHGAAQALRRHRIVVASEGGRAHTDLLQAGRGARCVAYLPMDVEDVTGGPESEGVLAVAFDERAPGGIRRATLQAIADLAAVATHRARIESALTERSDWFDRLAHTDGLTGLANRRTLDRVLALEAARAARQGTDLSLALFDIDGHGAIAAAHGSHVADDVLRRVASVLAETVRLVDTVGRFGRDEFLVVAPGSAGATIAQRIVTAVSRLDSLDGGDRISVSAGVASFPTGASSPEGLLAAAEEALRAAKRQGPGSIVAASPA